MKKNIEEIEYPNKIHGNVLLLALVFFILTYFIMYIVGEVLYHPELNFLVILSSLVIFIVLTPFVNSYNIDRDIESEIHKILLEKEFKYMILLNESLILCNLFEIDNKGNVFIPVTYQSLSNEKKYIHNQEVIKGEYDKIINIKKSGRLELLTKGKAFTSEELKAFVKNERVKKNKSTVLNFC